MSSRPDNELDQALAASAESGMPLRLTKDAPAIPYRPRALYGRPRTEREANRNARLERILQGLAKKSTIEGAVNGAERPDLAREIVRLFAEFTVRHQYDDPRPPRPHFRFDNLRAVDAGGKLARLLEDVCDRSTGTMGPWTSGISETARAAR